MGPTRDPLTRPKEGPWLVPSVPVAIQLPSAYHCTHSWPLLVDRL